jgi:hypothetical protein
MSMPLPIEVYPGFTAGNYVDQLVDSLLKAGPNFVEITASIWRSKAVHVMSPAVADKTVALARSVAFADR